MISQITTIFKMIDIFAIPIELTYKNCSKVGSVLGGIFTIILSGLFVCIFLLISSDIWERQNPHVYSSTINSQSTILLKDFPFRFVLYDGEENMITNIEKYLDVQIGIYSYTQQGKLQLQKMRNIVSCKQKVSQFSTQIQDQMNDQLLGFSYCIDFEDYDFINGDIQNYNSNFIDDAIFNCNIASCASQDEIYQKLLGGFIMAQFNGITIENNNDYQNPVHLKPFNLMINLSFYLYKLYQVNIGKSILQSDDGILLSNVENYNGMKLVSVLQDYSDVKSGSSNGEALIDIMIGWSQQELYINRSYMKIPEALGKVMGCYSLIFQFTIIFLRFYEKINFSYTFYKEVIEKEIIDEKIKNGTSPITCFSDKITPQSVSTLKEPDKLIQISYFTYFYYSCLSLLKQSSNSFKNNLRYKQFQFISDTSRNILSIEKLFENLKFSKNNRSSLNIFEQMNNYDISPEINLQETINSKISKQYEPGQSKFKKRDKGNFFNSQVNNSII